MHRPKCLDNQQLHTIQDKLKQKNELPLGSRDREDLVNEIKNQVSMGSCARSLNKNSYNALSIRCATRRRRHFVVHARTTPVFLQKIALRPSIFLKQRKGNGDKFLTFKLARHRIQLLDPTGATEILSRLKGNICNKEERKICCPLKASSEDVEEKPLVEETADTGIALHNFLINCVRASVTDEFREQNLCQPVWLGTNRQFY